MDGEWIPIPMDNWCAQGIPKPVAVTGSQSVFPIVCRVDNYADATNSFTSLTVDFEAMTAHWAESGSCVYSKAGTRQTHLAAVERADGNFAQADFHYNYPMIGSILEQNGQFYAFWKAAPSIRRVFLSWATIGIWNWRKTDYSKRNCGAKII